jgi:hypothetical protein
LSEEQDKSVKDQVAPSALADIPTLPVEEGIPTRYWHPVKGIQDLVQGPEWAVYSHMDSVAASQAGGLPVVGNSRELKITDGGLQCKLNMCKSSVQRSRRRLKMLGWIKVIQTGRGPGSSTEYRVYIQEALALSLKVSGCTHYCMRGERRMLYRAKK